MISLARFPEQSVRSVPRTTDALVKLSSAVLLYSSMDSSMDSKDHIVILLRFYRELGTLNIHHISRIETSSTEP